MLPRVIAEFYHPFIITGNLSEVTLLRYRVHKIFFHTNNPKYFQVDGGTESGGASGVLTGVQFTSENVPRPVDNVGRKCVRDGTMSSEFRYSL